MRLKLPSFTTVSSPTFTSPKPPSFEPSDSMTDEEVVEAFEEAIKNPPEVTLAAYDLPVTKIIEENSVKDIQEMEDQFLISILEDIDVEQQA